MENENRKEGRGCTPFLAFNLIREIMDRSFRFSANRPIVLLLHDADSSFIYDTAH